MLPTPSQNGNQIHWSLASNVTVIRSQNELSAITEYPMPSCWAQYRSIVGVGP